MPRSKLTFAKAGHAKRGEIVSAFGVAYVAKRDTDSSPPGEHWQTAIVRSEAFAGLNGRDGADGRNGRDGKDAAPGKDGQGFTPRGEWRRFAVYERGDVVTHEGSSYVCKADSTRKEPPGAEWMLLAAAGERGLRGLEGPQGIGQRGRKGADGISITDAEPILNLTASDTIERGMVVRLVGGGDEVTRASSFAWYPAMNVIGLASTAAATGEPCKVAYQRLTLNDWSAALESGEPTLVSGANYFLSKTLGKLQTGEPQTGELICMGVAINETTLLIDIDGIVQWNKPVLATIDSAGVKGMFVRPAENGHIDLAIAQYPFPQYMAIGYLTNDFGSGEEASVNINGGCLTLPDWSGITEDASSTLIEDDVYYLSDTVPGKITNVEPENPLQLGTADSATKLNITLGKAKFSIQSVPHCG